MKAIGRLAGCVVMAGICLLAVRAQEPSTGGKGGTATEDLRNLMTTALTAARQGDHSKLEEISRGLMIPEYEMWFKAVFGEEQGAKMGAAYRVNFEQAEKAYPKLFEWEAQQEGELVIEDAKTLPKRSDSWCGQTLANAIKGDISLYRVSVGQADSGALRSGRTAGYFVLVGGAYRRLDCQMLGLGSESSTAPPHPMGPLRVGGNVQAARILRRVAPEYPMDARMAHISGTVRLHVIIGKDGGIKQLEVISGHPALTGAALDAVRQWRYKQTLLNGEPVEVDTTIDVIFALN
jgi:TonB family protein